MVNINSKFKLLTVFLAVVLSIFPIFIFLICFIAPNAGNIVPVLFMLFFTYFILTEFRKRACKITINSENIELRRFFGLGKYEIYDFKRLDGFITSFQSGRSGTFEFLFVIKNGKRAACVSSFYHTNYDELKEVLKMKLIDLGDENRNRTH